MEVTSPCNDLADSNKKSKSRRQARHRPFPGDFPGHLECPAIHRPACESMAVWGRVYWGVGGGGGKWGGGVGGPWILQVSQVEAIGDAGWNFHLRMVGQPEFLTSPPHALLGNLFLLLLCFLPVLWWFLCGGLIYRGRHPHTGW